ncbi:MAG: outer membrane beta-barrel protein, partial [bacterium]
MIKRIILIIPILILTVNLYCNKEGFCQIKNIGIKSGLNLSNADIEYPFGSLPTFNKLGFNATLFYDFLNYSNLSLSGEAGYSQRGYTDEVIVTNEFGIEQYRYKIQDRLNYIDIALIAKLILRKKSFSPYVTAGPTLSIYTGYSEISDSLSYSAGDNLLLKQLKKTTLGFKVGIGAEINNI